MLTVLRAALRGLSFLLMRVSLHGLHGADGKVFPSREAGRVDFRCPTLREGWVLTNPPRGMDKSHLLSVAPVNLFQLSAEAFINPSNIFGLTREQPTSSTKFLVRRAVRGLGELQGTRTRLLGNRRQDMCGSVKSGIMRGSGCKCLLRGNSGIGSANFRKFGELCRSKGILQKTTFCHTAMEMIGKSGGGGDEKDIAREDVKTGFMGWMEREFVSMYGGREAGRRAKMPDLKEVWGNMTADIDTGLLALDTAIVFSYFFARGAIHAAIAEGPGR